MRMMEGAGSHVDCGTRDSGTARGKCHLRAFNTNVHHCHGPLAGWVGGFSHEAILVVGSSQILVRCGKHSAG